MKLKIISLAIFAATSVQARNKYPSVDRVKQDIILECRAQNINPRIMLAIADRESAYGATLDGEWKGDKGNGFGVFQIDRRFHSEFLNNNNWRDTRTSCAYAIKLIKANLKQFGNINQAIAAYNCGAGNVSKTLKYKRDVDYYTTGRNYSFDVIKRMQKMF